MWEDRHINHTYMVNQFLKKCQGNSLGKGKVFSISCAEIPGYPYGEKKKSILHNTQKIAWNGSQT